MESNAPQNLTRATWEKYQDNLFRHLMTIGRHAETELVLALQQKGYENLSIRFAYQLVPIALNEHGIRITDLANLQGISKQLCYQALRPIEKAGYIFREDDPSDGRAKLVRLTTMGTAMVNDAFAELDGISKRFASLTGNEQLKNLNRYLAKITPSFLYEGKNIPRRFLDSNILFAASVGQVSRYYETQLINLNTAKGHQSIKPSFTQVLAYLNLSGTALNHIAQILQISNQAVLRIAIELEKLGYLRRTANSNSPTDKRRSSRLFFTPQGLQLITDSVESVITLEDEIKLQLGETHYRDFSLSLENLFRKIRKSNQILKDYDPNTVHLKPAINEESNTEQPLLLEELLLFIASLFEQEATHGTASEKLTRNLGNLSSSAESPVVFSPAANRVLSNTAIQPSAVIKSLEQLLGRKSADSLIKQITNLAKKTEN